MADVFSVLESSLRDKRLRDSTNMTWLNLLQYIRANGLVKEISIDTNIRIEYIGDLHGLMIYLNTNRRLQYINMLLNGYNSSNEYDGGGTTLLIVNEIDEKIRYILDRIN